MLWLVACGGAGRGSIAATPGLGDAAGDDAGQVAAGQPEGGYSGGGSLTAEGGGQGTTADSDAVSGGSCAINADCADSSAAQAIQNVRCVGSETYCVGGVCYADCASSCTPVRTDVNPCASPRFCSAGLHVCKIVPLRCQSPSDCPSYLPPLADGGTASWNCDAGVCAYPGVDYATH